MNNLVVDSLSNYASVAEQLRISRTLFMHATEGIMITNNKGIIVDVNESFTHITGYTRDEVIGQNPKILNSGRQGENFYRALWHSLKANQRWQGEIWNRRKNGEVYAEILNISAVVDHQGQVKHYIGLFSDITSQKKHQKELDYIAHYDHLTGLPNAAILQDRLQQTMSQAVRRGDHLAVVYLDLDGFTEINETYGHSIGDQLIIHASQRIRGTLRNSDTLARVGGDDFVAILTDFTCQTHAAKKLEQILESLSMPFVIAHHELKLSASLGVTFFPQSLPISSEQLLRQADQAMYQAKMAGKNRFHFFDTEHDRHQRGLHERISRLAEALEKHEFKLHYQPKINMRSGELLGVEALIRWQHPEKGLIGPGFFLPDMLNHPLMNRVGDWVLDTALQQASQWRDEGLNVKVSVNIDPMQMQQTDFVEKIRKSLIKYPNLSPASLELEILETSALEDISAVSNLLNACKALGVSIDLDDFGTGYSSLSYLKRLPVDMIKIDQSFVRDMLVDPDDRSILEGIIGLADTFNRDVIAEGVETEEHGNLLLQLGCEKAQGYAIAKPMPGEHIQNWLTQWCRPLSWQ